MNPMKRLSQVGWYLTGLLYASPVFAALPVVTPAVDGNPITLSDILELVERLVRTFIALSLVVMAGGVIYTGLRMIMARGVPAEFDAAKKQLWQVVVGSTVILGVGLILSTIANFVKDPVGATGGSSIQRIVH
jgi:hypothetical protein